MTRKPLIFVLIGMAGAMAVMIFLFVSDFALADLWYYAPALAVSALLIFAGAARLKKKGNR